MKRFFDFIFSFILILLLLLPMLLVAALVRFTSKGSIIYWSDRVGKNNVIFKMPKFRSMYIDSPTMATHLLENSQELFSPVGSFFKTNKP